MVLKCIVRDCRSEWHPACDVIFHKFPSDTTERNKWLSTVPLRRAFFQNARICSLHFKDTDYDSSGKRLLFGVTPIYEECNVRLMSDGEQTVTKTIQPTSLNYEMEMGNMPSTSHHESMPLRDTTNEIENIRPSKKPRLLDILDTPQPDVKKSKQVNNQSTSPIQFAVDKSEEAKIKTPREKGLEKRNKICNQKVRRLNKSVKSLKSLMKLVKSYASNSEIEDIIQL